MLWAGILNFKFRIVFWNIFFGDWDIWNTNRTFWKKDTFSYNTSQFEICMYFTMYVKQIFSRKQSNVCLSLSNCSLSSTGLFLCTPNCHAKIKDLSLAMSRMAWLRSSWAPTLLRHLSPLMMSFLSLTGRDLYIGKNQKLFQNQNSNWRNFAKAK